MGCFCTWQKGAFLFVSFPGFNVIVFLNGKVARVLKCLFFFPSFLGFVGWLLLVYLGLEGLGVFVFLVFAFLFGVGFVSVCLLCFFVVGCCCSCFCFFCSFWRV